ncbi:terminase large subunit (endogenous virus) [Clostridium phage phiCTC2B]|uniref:Terminase n=1 Tax=Clostridium tetani (strain Massachusetts / E88) TaxID=212717 RepID=Q892G7_CLOTE|nr:terminase TerL endonuclease subunit [Clostridium tetani]YP_009276929.1 terminase large subunit [Clostridium phage phiCT19406B]YP_009277373.1 terminase large subunit [Clostridium phage phiCTC2B]AAO36628.1 terminase [Clostridium tetani E88]AJA42789.1 terminase large subunit [Clostridium phage phiCT19406B]AJA42985.1 terminase large subunit [Clostridium phage phiCTC2B]KGI39117.1 terminase [Clostridium tetani]KGI43686.1 terminase [Clostridium tetani]
MILLDRAIKYATDVVEGRGITTWEVKKQCAIFIQDYYKRQHEESFEFYIDIEELSKINDLLKLMNFATGYLANNEVLEHLDSFQCFFICNIFGWRHKNNKAKFRYNDVTLFIARKNGKTALIGLVFILLLLTEQQYSEFYSICLTKELAAEIKKIMEQIINASLLIKKHFNISTTKTGRITCKLTNSFFEPRVAEAGKNNSIRPSAFVSDEHGNFQNADNFNAMKSGQKNVINPLVFRTTTAYAINNSIMEEDLDYIRKVYNCVVDNERMFALIYYADKENIWNDKGLYQANPLQLEENYKIMREDRAKALVQDNLKEEFITKTCNVFTQENSEEKYLNIEEWKKCEVDKIDFNGKEVVVGVDLSITTDLTAVSIMCKEEGKYYLHSKGFLPSETLSKRREKIDYRLYERLGYCEIHDGYIINYTKIEEYIRSIESTYNCKIKCIVSDPYNALQMMESLSSDYEVILLKQTYTNLSAPTKSFRDDVYEGKIVYQKNKLLDWCVSCATTNKGKAEDIMLDKENKNKQRIDLLVASTFCYSQLYLLDNKIDINEVTEDYLNMMGW